VLYISTALFLNWCLQRSLWGRGFTASIHQ